MHWRIGAAFDGIGGGLRSVGDTIRARPALSYGALVLLVVFGLVLQPRVHIFTLDVATEIAVFTTTDEVLTRWDLGASSRLIDDPFAKSSAGRSLEPHAQLIVHKGTQIDVQRHGTGDVRVRLTRDDKGSTGRIELHESGDDLGDWAVLLIEPAGTPVLFPFRGTVTVGYDVAAGVDSVLQSGTVSVVEEQLIGGARYTANTENLDPGDRVELRDDGSWWWSPSKLSIVSGFVRAEPATGYSEPMEALGLVAHGAADFVQVDRLGSTGYKIRAPRWARFLHDPLLAAGTAIIALFVLLMEVGTKCSECVAAYRERNSSDEDRERAGKPGDADENA